MTVYGEENLGPAFHEDGREECPDGRHLAAPVCFALAAWS